MHQKDFQSRQCSILLTYVYFFSRLRFLVVYSTLTSDNESQQHKVVQNVQQCRFEYISDSFSMFLSINLNYISVKDTKPGINILLFHDYYQYLAFQLKL